MKPYSAGEPYTGRRVDLFVSRIEQLARQGRMLDLLRDGSDFIGYQSQLASVQAEIQRDIGQLKKSVRKNKQEVLPALSTLRRLLWYSRCLGDAFAWQVMIFDRKAIAALMHGTRQPVAQATTSTTAVFATAGYFLSRRVGIPIVHDITNWLRIGDITLSRFDGDDGTSPRVQTVELKSSISGSFTDDDGVEQMDVVVNAYSSEPIELGATGTGNTLSVPRSESGPSTNESSRNNLRDDRRLEKQFRRLEDMIVRRDMKDNAITNIDGVANVVLLLDHEPLQHWSELNRAIRSARKAGYASFNIDNFITYAVFYKKDGVTEEFISRFREPVVNDMVNSIITPTNSENSFILVRQIPMKEDYDIEGFPILRFFSYKIPKIAVDDFLRNRLLITGTANFGRLDAAFAAEGLTVFEKESNIRKQGYPYAVDVSWPTGESLRFGIPYSQVSKEVERALYEFNGLESVVEHVGAMKHLPDLIPYDEWKAAMEV